MFKTVVGGSVDGLGLGCSKGSLTNLAGREPMGWQADDAKGLLIGIIIAAQVFLPREGPLVFPLL